MLDTFVIFGAKYLWLFGPFLALAYFLFQPRAKKKELALLVAITLPLTYIIAKGIGFLYYNPRPFVLGDFIPLVRHVADNGFPSDHTLILAALAAVVIFYNRVGGILLFLLALAVGASRVFVGLHHTVDVAGSIAISVLAAALVYYVVLPPILKRTSKLI